MQRQPGKWDIRRPGVAYPRYKENFQWNQKFRPQGQQFQGNFQTCDYQYWCETCDKGFATARFLENHKYQHQKCNIDGCQFVAHPKIITKHIQMQHSTGLFKKISKLNNPEEIKKWREERKKKYPTIENIKKKAAEIQEKINRGEKMGMKYERGKRNDKRESQHKINRRMPSQVQRKIHPQGRNIKNITNNRKRGATDVINKTDYPKKICKIIPTTEENRTLKPFGGIQSLQNYELDEESDPVSITNVPIEDDEDSCSAIDTLQTETNVSEPTVCSALTSLMGCYASSDEDYNDDDSNIQTKEVKKSLCENKAKITNIKSNDKSSNQEILSKNIENSKNSAIRNCEDNKVKVTKSTISNCQDVSDNESGPEEINISKEGTNLPIDCNKSIKSKPVKELPKNSRPSDKKHDKIIRKRKKLPSTLLEKLLHRDIQHERNVILQCVRYVVNNKYFDKS